MPRWTRIASVTDCPPDTAKELVVGDRILALFHVGGQFYVLDGICPHQGGPLGQGTLTGCLVTCPWHGWQFDVRTGQHQASGSLRHAVFPVKIENDDILVDLDA